jgi:hypothetical protein
MTRLLNRNDDALVVAPQQFRGESASTGWHGQTKAVNVCAQTTRECSLYREV